MKPHSTGSSVVTGAVGLLVLFQVIALQFFGPAIDRHIDADSAGYILFIEAVVFKSAKVSDWYLGTHLYLFPDGVFVALSLILGKLGIALHHAVIGIYAIAWYCALVLALKNVVHRDFRDDVLIAGAIYIVAYWTSYGLFGAGWFETEMMSHLLAPSTHSGSIWSAVVCFSLIPVTLSTKRPVAGRLAMGLLFALVFLTTLSDIIFVVWAIPAVLVIVVIQPQGSHQKKIVTAAAMATACALGGGFSTLVVAQNEVRWSYVERGRAPLIESLSALVQFLWDGASFHSPSQGFLFYSNVVLGLASGYCLYSFAAKRSASYHRLVIFSSALVVCALAGAGLSGLFRGVVTMRYIMPYVIVGYFFFAALLISIMQSGPAKLFVVTLGSLGAAYLAASGPERTASALHTCLRRAGLSAGAAHYWDANQLSLESASLQIVPLAPDGPQFYPWNTNRQRLQNPDIQFVVSRIDVEKADAARFGPIRERVVCANRVILIR